MKELAEQLIPLCDPEIPLADAASLKWGKDGSQKTALQAAVKEASEIFQKKIAGVVPKNRSALDLSAWGHDAALSDAGLTHTDVDGVLRQICEKNSLKLGDLAQPMRLAVTGKLVSPGLFDLMEVLPWRILEERLVKVQSF